MAGGKPGGCKKKRRPGGRVLRIRKKHDKWTTNKYTHRISALPMSVTGGYHPEGFWRGNRTC